MANEVSQYMGLIVAAIFIFGLLVLFITRHVKPLTEIEMKQLARKRRDRDIKGFYEFDKRQCYVDPSEKSNMKANGKYYDIEKTLFGFPSYAAALLKYKKHEWIVVAFCRDKEVLKMWVNKGIDNASASIYIETEDMIRKTKDVLGNAVLFFHNHPNTDPSRYCCKMPSKLDLQTAKNQSSCLRERGINLIEFVCERGFHHQYWFSISDMFMPLQTFIDAIVLLNGRAKWRNFILHLERLGIF
jgi:hypothetical protein